MTVARKFDGHVHLFDGGYFGDLSGAEEVEQYDLVRARRGIERALVVGYEGDARFAGNNSFINELSLTLPWVSPLAYVDAKAELPASVLSPESRFVGISVYPKSVGITWSDESLRRFSETERLVSINAGADLMPFVSELAAALPDTPILLSHLGLPGPLISGATVSHAREMLHDLLALSAAKNVVVKVSGLYAIDPEFPHAGARTAFEIIRDAFGTGRLVWGSDFAPALEKVKSEDLGRLPEWLETSLNGEERDAVLYGNLASLIAAQER